MTYDETGVPTRRAEAQAAVRHLTNPHQDTPQVPSKLTWRIRASRRLDATVRDLSTRTGLTRSAIIRQAVEEYARAHG
ncbi:MAG: ribbon-helix-helix protein, CopG family [Micrococcales bacterium]|nr:ribbon-helix-helix protein, CopG family [Micrococcales bacterium]MCL2668962.1 ribbon-helix-helix protein, CopG family [Micrococcales bacterium]